MHIEFVGAAREVTGSCHLLHINGRVVALDCGLFQGRRAESRVKNEKTPFDPATLDAVVLSHAHIDHAGRLPMLVKRGFRNTIWATAATRDLCAVMLADSAHIQEKDADFLERRGQPHAPPLYTMEDATRTQQQMIGVPYDKWIDVLPGVRALFVDAGHILGSASVVIEAVERGETKRLIFSGDIGRAGLPIIRDPVPPKGGADVVILESTYGNRDHETVTGAREHLASIVRDTAARGGRILIPSFAVGRTQELVYDLHELHRAARIPTIPIVIDSPLAFNATTVFELHPEIFDRNEDLVRITNELFEFPMMRFTRDVNESKALNSAVGPMIIISASGMAESGRILHHLLRGADDPRNTILIVGYQAEHTLGRRIVEKRPMLKILGQDVPLRATVEILNGYSAHGDRTELHAWLNMVRDDAKRVGRPVQRVHLVHGESEAQDAFAARLRQDGYTVDTPSPGDTRPL